MHFTQPELAKPTRKITGRTTLAMALTLALTPVLGFTGCAQKNSTDTKISNVKAVAEKEVTETVDIKTRGTDYSLVTPKIENEGEFPTWLIPNMPESAEAYYGPDSYHVIEYSIVFIPVWNDRGLVIKL